jgi:hypothetical protein
LPSSLHIIAIHPRRRPVFIITLSSLVLSVVVDVLDVEGVDVAREVAEKGEADVDEQVCTAACDAVDADGWH